MIIVFLQRRLKEKLPIFLINTPLLHIPLLALTDRQNDRETNTLAVHGLEELYSSCAVVSVFGSSGKQVLVLHTYVLRVQYSCGFVLVFWFWQEIVFGVTYVPSVQNSCAVVLWREIVLKMRTHFEFLLGYFVMIRKPMCIFHKT